MIYELFKMWNEANVNYCHWKSNEHLIEGLKGKTDLDILIDPESEPKALEILLKTGFKRVMSHTWKNYSGVEDWIGCDTEKLSQVHLHIHYRVITGLEFVKEQYLPWSNIVLSEAVMGDANVRICNPNIELIILLARSALKANVINALFWRGLPDSVMKEFLFLQKKIDLNSVEEYARKMLSDESEIALMSFYNNINSKKEYLKWRNKILAEFPEYRKCSRFKSECLHFFRKNYVLFFKVIKHPVNLKKKVNTGGKLISFIGVDGSGKTTLAKYFNSFFSWKIDCKYVYLGTGDGKTSLLNRIAKKINVQSISIANSKKNERNDIVANKDLVDVQISFKNQVKRLIWNVLILSNAKYRLKTVQRIFCMVNEGTIVITDRYPQLQFSGIYDGLNIKEFQGNSILVAINNTMRKKERQCFTQICKYNPDVVIKLHIPPEVSFERKPCTEREKQTILRKAELTDKIKYGNARVFNVDSSGELQTTKTEVCKILWKEL